MARAIPPITPSLPDIAALVIPPIRENPQYAAAEAALCALEARFAETERRKKVALARAKGAKSSRSVSEMAAALVSGGRVHKPNVVDELAATEEEDRILRDAILEATRKLNQVSGELSYEISEKHKPLFNQTMVAALRAMEDLAAAIGTAEALTDRLRDGGYRPTSGVFPDIVPQGARALGNPAHGVSQSSWFRRTLENMGVL